MYLLHLVVLFLLPHPGASSGMTCSPALSWCSSLQGTRAVSWKAKITKRTVKLLIYMYTHLLKSSLWLVAYSFQIWGNCELWEIFLISIKSHYTYSWSRDSAWFSQCQRAWRELDLYSYTEENFVKSSLGPGFRELFLIKTVFCYISVSHNY